jgi:hypothetical protein
VDETDFDKSAGWKYKFDKYRQFSTEINKMKQRARDISLHVGRFAGWPCQPARGIICAALHRL